MRVFLDSNALISALIGEADSAPVVLIDWMAGGRPGSLITSTLNVAEVERNLSGKLPDALPWWPPPGQGPGESTRKMPPSWRAP